MRAQPYLPILAKYINYKIYLEWIVNILKSMVIAIPLFAILHSLYNFYYITLTFLCNI